MEWGKSYEIKELQYDKKVIAGEEIPDVTLPDEDLYLNEECLKEKYNIINFDCIPQYNLQKIFIIVIHEEDDNYFLYHKRDAKIAFERFRIYGEYNKLHVQDPKYLSIPIKLSRIQVQVMTEQGICLVCQRYVKEDCKGQVSIPVDIPSDDIIKKNAINAIKGRKRKANESLANIICNKEKIENDDCKNYNESISNDISSEEIEKTVIELKNKLYEKRRVIKEGTFQFNFHGCYYMVCELLPNHATDVQRYGSKLKAFRDLWRKGFWLVDGYKFGCDYLAYDKTPMENHSKFLVNIIPSSNNIKPLELIALLRIATQVNKDLLLVITDSESLVPHYSIINWWKGINI